MGLTRSRCTATAACGILAALALAQPLRAQSLGQGDVCDQGTKTVDRERLALFALAASGVSPYPYRWAESHPSAVGDALSAAQRLLSVEGFCGLEPKAENGIPRCGQDDQAKLSNALNLVLDLLNDTDNYEVPPPITGVTSFFSMKDLTVACRVAPGAALKKPAPTAIAAPFDQKTIPLRIRGTTEGLQFDRNRDSAFNGVEKAAISVKEDRAAGKDTFKAALVAALAIPVIEDVLEISPYFGIQTDTTKKNGQSKEVSEDILRAGALLDFRTHGSGISHLFLLRPEFSTNRKERSEIVTGTFVYQPLWNGHLNDAINLTTADNRSLFSIIPRFDVRLAAGDFTKLGLRLPQDSIDFVRVGGQVGLTVTSDIKWLPLELTATETYLHALRGSPDDLSYLRAIFSIYFDEKKYFGVDLGYARGRKDDLSKREQNWTFGFGAKF